MIYQNADLKTTGIVLGVALIATHIIALLKGESVKSFLKDFPRNRTAGIILMTINALWAWWVVSSMDLGEFTALKQKILFIIPVAYLLIVIFVEEFLAVRALGTLMLLGSCVVLDAAWFEVPSFFPQSKLLLPVLAYAWIIVGMFWVGMPYLMRDQISWLQHASRWRAACTGGIVYGALTLGCALAFWH